ncbi:MAG: NADH-quinone oxidoreductase subunit N [Actinobacteria bacterium]|nr:NADH-quinone oxidoreductase subunit N [Actinomycetota bacterium]
MGNIAFLPIGLEVALLVGAIGVLMVAVTMGRSSRDWAVVAGAAIGVGFVISVRQWVVVGESGTQLAFGTKGADGLAVANQMVAMDKFGALGGMILMVVVGLALIGSWQMVKDLGSRGAEFVALILLSAAGMHMMIVSANLIMLFIGLETASIALYVIAGFLRNRRGSDESAMKYFLMGSFASALFIYGVALVFAATGSTSLYGSTSIGQFLAGNAMPNPGILLIGIGLILVGLAFKMSAAPFHQWAPDVYQGAGTGAVAFMSTGVKVAAVAAMVRVLYIGFFQFYDDWSMAVALIAALSILVGTATAIAQSDLKRMLAYSGVAHAGFLLIAVLAARVSLDAMWFYLATYAVSLVGMLTVVTVVAGASAGPVSIESFRGLGKRSPMLAAAIAVFMFSMAGIPGTSGFVAKLVVFTAADLSGFRWLVVLALVASVAGLFFYLRIIVVAFFEDSDTEETPLTLTGPRIAIGFAVAVTVGLGLWPTLLLDFAREALPHL